MGAGQFCTNPGLVIAFDSPALDRFIAAAAEALPEVEPPVMLTPGIHRAYVNGRRSARRRMRRHDAWRQVRQARSSEPLLGALFETSAQSFLAARELGDEVFGSSSLVVRCKDAGEMAEVIAGLEGQLTATLHATR